MSGNAGHENRLNVSALSVPTPHVQAYTYHIAVHVQRSTHQHCWSHHFRACHRSHSSACITHAKQMHAWTGTCTCGVLFRARDGGVLSLPFSTSFRARKVNSLALITPSLLCTCAYLSLGRVCEIEFLSCHSEHCAPR